jgi:acyl carrier protein
LKGSNGIVLGEHGVSSVDEVIAVLKCVVSEMLATRIPADHIDENAPLLDGGVGLDSVMLVDLIATVEKRLDFEFQVSDLRPRSFANLTTLAHVIAARLRDSD